MNTDTALIILFGLFLTMAGAYYFIENYHRPDASITITLPSGPDVFQP